MASRLENKIAEILNSSASTKLKWLRLGNLALKQFPSSPNQALVKSAMEKLGFSHASSK